VSAVLTRQSSRPPVTWHDTAVTVQFGVRTVQRNRWLPSSAGDSIGLPTVRTGLRLVNRTGGVTKPANWQQHPRQNHDYAVL
jgi:hypothetical protein